MFPDSQNKHSLLPVSAGGAEEFEQRNTRFEARFIKLFFLGCVALLFWAQPCFRSRSSGRVAPPLGLPENIQRHWGQYSPWFPNEKYIAPPAQCEITQVNVLQRHGARYPNSDDDYDNSIQKLLRAEKFADSRFDFLREYKYHMDEEELTSFGAAQSFESGEASYKRYAHLVSSENIPFVRSASKSRVVSSALNWTVGFSAASQQRYNPTVDVILPENQNNTLFNDCPNAGDGSKEMATWLSVFAPPIVRRLENVAPGSNVTEHDIFNLLAMCPFETIAKQRASEFCGLFTYDEFKQFEYHGDVEKFYKTGYGEPLGRVQGVGYMNEIIARLTGRPVVDHTQHNDSFPFPLGRTLYADFTHENLMVAVYAAMGLFNTTDKLSTKEMDNGRDWLASVMVPFSARVVIERLACTFDGDQNGGEETEYVRVLVNDAVQQLDFCCSEDNGLCTLRAFVESQAYARGNGLGDFERCYN
ncbi:acid phosphatase [Abortiporus biennis]|nr:acid phosphatase [Abortiporus biennis]